MIENALRQMDHSLLGLVGRGVYDFIRTCSQNVTDNQITQIVLNIFFVIASTWLAVLYHNSTVYAFSLGFIFSDYVGLVADKVDTVFRAQSTFARRHILVLGGGFLTLFFQPTTVHVLAVCLSAYFGARLYQSSHSRCQQHDEQQQLLPPV